MATEVRKSLAQAVDAIEGAYEYFLAYAAQGVRDEAMATKTGGQLRRHLEATASALGEIPTLVADLLRDERGDIGEELEAFRTVLSGDAERAGAVVGLIRAQRSITSQLVDNLNASVHVRTVLTDLFILDEALNLGVDAATEPTPSKPIP